MKIGILTYHSVFNFGANLQTYSTVEYLKNNGFEPIVINWIPEDLEARYDKTIPIEQANAHKMFIKDFLPCTAICRNSMDIARVIKKENINGIIVGSDAVLQHNPFLSRFSLTRKGIIYKKHIGSDILFPNPFWGSFIPYLDKSIPAVIMSASSQNTSFNYIVWNLRKTMNIFLNQFKLITVRDNWTRKMVKYLTHGTIIPPITPDPVFAYNQNVKEQYSQDEILKKFNLPEKYILLSFRDTKVVSNIWLNSFQKIAEDNNLQCVALTMPYGIYFEPSFPLVVKAPLCPKEWYGLIKYSSGYVGENMHPIIVALHNAVPFYSFDNYGIVNLKFFVNEHSSKIYDILSQAGFLKNRISRLGRAYKCPFPEEVFQHINNFDYSKCRQFNNTQLDRYNRMMKSITSFF
jgi:hypothetical protein